MLHFQKERGGICTYRGSPWQFLFLKIATALPIWTGGEQVIIPGVHSNEGREPEGK